MQEIYVIKRCDHFDSESHDMHFKFDYKKYASPLNDTCNQHIQSITIKKRFYMFRKCLLTSAHKFE